MAERRFHPDVSADPVFIGEERRCRTPAGASGFAVADQLALRCRKKTERILVTQVFFGCEGELRQQIKSAQTRWQLQGMFLCPVERRTGKGVGQLLVQAIQLPGSEFLPVEVLDPCHFLQRSSAQVILSHASYPLYSCSKFIHVALYRLPTHQESRKTSCALILCSQSIVCSNASCACSIGNSCVTMPRMT